jgi:hypothetical protein
MEFIAARDFRVRPGMVWKKLKKSGSLFITSRGKPVAMLRDVEGHDLAEEIKFEALAKGMAAVSRMREHALHTGLAGMSEVEIENEIQSARKGR